jgi:glutathione transport system substrate-binding protein
MMCQGLYILDKDMKLVPGLAESYEANEEATQFIFHLRHGVTFQDGTPFNAEAVKSAYDRAGNPENHLKRQSLFVMINHTDVIDDYTVKLTLKYPFGALINDLAHPGALIVSPTAVQKWGKEFTRHPVCTGPYEFVSWSADTLKLKKNEHYWKPGLPKFDTITYRNIPENGARIAALRAGEVQFIYPVPPEMIKSLEGNPAIKIFNEQSILSLYVTMHTQRKPFDDLRVRQALNYAIDKQSFINVVYSGYADEMDSVMPPRCQSARKRDPLSASKKDPVRYDL